MTGAVTGHEPEDAEASPENWYLWLRAAICAGFLLAGLSVLAAIAFEVLVHGRIWSGALGYAPDSMQYLAFIREASDHLLVSDPFAAGDNPRIFLNPAFAISGVIVRLGVPIPVVWASWVPVGAALLVVGSVLAVEATIRGSWPRLMALALGLGYSLEPGRLIDVGETAANHIPFSAAQGDAVNLTMLFGWPISAAGVGLCAIALVFYMRLRIGSGGGLLRLCLPALLAAWLNPWSAALIVVTVALSELAVRRGQGWRSGGLATVGGWAPAAVTAGPAALALAYYGLIERLSPALRSSGQQSLAMNSGMTWWMFLLPILVLILPATLAIACAVSDFRLIVILSWAAAGTGLALTAWFLEVGNDPQHFLRDLSTPLAILAVTGIGRLLTGRPPVLAVAAAVAALVMLVALPGWLLVRDQVHEVTRPDSDRFIAAGEQSAFRYLDRQTGPGAVFAPGPMGSMVPWRTGRVPLAGHRNLTPDYLLRVALQRQYLNGTGPASSPFATQLFLRTNDLRYSLLGCRLPLKLVYGFIVRAGKNARVIRFGCATVVQQGAKAPLLTGAPDPVAPSRPVDVAREGG